MMMKRDSNGWWWIMGGAILTAVSSRTDVIDRLIPMTHRDWVHALIELLAIIAIAVSGVARMSPLDISPEGRRKAIRRDTGHLPKASIAAAVANVAASKAASVTKDAADKAEVAKDLAKPGAE